MTKRLISLLLALVLVLSVLPLGVSAEETLPEETQPEDSGNPGWCFHWDSDLKNVAEATCSQAGYTGDLTCNDCGRVLIPGFALPKKDHTFEEGVCTVCGALEAEDPNVEPCYHLDTSLQNIAEASCTQEGYTGDWVCDACGKVLISGITIPMREHRYEEGICTECGAEESTETEPSETTPTETNPAETEPEETEPEETRCYHLNSSLENVTQRTCTQDGYTGDLVCGSCGEVLFTGYTLPAEGHNYEDGICTECGEADPDYVVPDVVRIYGSNRCATAIEVADALKKALNIEKFDVILYTSGKDFADALAGSYLAAQRKAPILLHLEGSSAANLDYVRDNLAEDGTVYILGGKSAVPETMDAAFQLLGIRTQRLAGATRYDTNLEILREGNFFGGEILICNAHNFPDSLSASATGLPILLVDEDWTELSAAQRNYLKEAGSKCSFTIIGGKAVVSEALEKSLSAYGTAERIFGATRYETSLQVAQAFFPDADRAVLAYAKNFPDGLCGGPLAHFLGAPLILTENNKADIAAAYTAGNAITKGIVLGGESLISDAAANQIFGKQSNIL